MAVFIKIVSWHKGVHFFVILFLFELMNNFELLFEYSNNIRIFILLL
jgi:hypothetical protein